MATFETYDTAQGRRWKIQYRKPDRRLTTKRGFRTKKAAQDWWAQQAVAMQKGEFVAPSAGQVTVKVAAADLRARLA